MPEVLTGQNIRQISTTATNLIHIAAPALSRYIIIYYCILCIEKIHAHHGEHLRDVQRVNVLIQL